MKRMMYTLLMYDTAAAGLEVYLFYPQNTTLSPMGTMLSAAKKWADTTPIPDRGVHLATTGLLMDYFAGWETPCSDPGWPFSTVRMVMG